jgi:hypothetical protein
MSPVLTGPGRIGVVMCMLCFGLWALASPPLATAAPGVGDRAPDFTLPATTGGSISLSQFRGKKIVLLEFYGADFSPV